MEKLIAIMKTYNFTEYETKAYVTLLELGKATGYELSKQSSIPRSKIYNILETLYKKGLVQKNQGEQIYYIAIPVEEFVNLLSQKTTSDIILMENLLTPHAKSTYDRSEMWNIDGYDNVIFKAKQIVTSAKDELLIQVWKEDLDQEFIDLLKEAESRIEHFILILFSATGDYKMPFERYYAHYFEDKKLEEMKTRWMNISVNSDTMLMGTIYNYSVAHAITTQYVPMVFLSKEYILHDAYTANIIKHLDNTTKEKFGAQLEKIRDIF